MTALGVPAALAAALVGILENREDAETMGAAGRAVALAEFPEDRMIERFLSAYRGLSGVQA